jgi:hypothetical protein
MRPDGSNARRIDFNESARLPNIGLTPVGWSEDGNRLLATMNEHENAEPYAVDLAKQRVWRISRGEFIEISDISRDGRSVLVVRNGLDSTPPPQVETIPFTGGKPQIVAVDSFGPSWNQ